MRRSGLLTLIVLLAIGTFLISGCETQEQNDVAEAQKCLDGLGVNADPTTAQGCLTKIQNINSPEANTIRCSVDFIVGGITDSALITAYTNIKGKSGNQVVTYLSGALAQHDSSGTYSTALAQTTYNDCVNSQVTSLVYLSGISLTGTIVVAAAQTAAGGGAIDTSDPSAYINTCQTTPSSCSPSTIGSVASTVEANYCVGSTITSDICTSLNTAITNGAGDPTTIGNNILALLQQ